jgi:hypothetical protein
MPRQHFYDPDRRGFEAELKRRLQRWQEMRSARRSGDDQASAAREPPTGRR